MKTTPLAVDSWWNYIWHALPTEAVTAHAFLHVSLYCLLDDMNRISYSTDTALASDVCAWPFLDLYTCLSIWILYKLSCCFILLLHRRVRMRFTLGLETTLIYYVVQCSYASENMVDVLVSDGVFSVLVLTVSVLVLVSCLLSCSWVSRQTVSRHCHYFIVVCR